MARSIRKKGPASSFDLYADDRLLGVIEIGMPGSHMIYNSLATAAVALEVGVPFETIQKSLRNFQGVARRMERKGEVKGVLFLDDYGHHPTEIEVTLCTIKEVWERRLITVFQPHRYSRTYHLTEEFGKAFYHTDIVIVTDVYAAGEERIEGGSGERIADAVRTHGHRHVIYVSVKEDIPAAVLPLLSEGDILLTLGAGNIWRIGEQIMTEWRERKIRV
jgi:UDP-N-acetylmuramate--alanine ligase